MGVGPYWNSRVDLQQALDWTTSKLGSMWEWVQSYADSHVMYAPLMTPFVAGVGHQLSDAAGISLRELQDGKY